MQAAIFFMLAGIGLISTVLAFHNSRKKNASPDKQAFIFILGLGLTWLIAVFVTFIANNTALESDLLLFLVGQLIIGGVIAFFVVRFILKRSK